MNTNTQSSLPISAGAQKVVIGYLAVCGAVLALLMVFGLLLRLGQGGMVPLPADLSYQVLTAHGIGMVGISGLGGAAIMWYFLARQVALNSSILLLNLGLFLLGVVLILGAVFIGGFAGAWTFLYPLPAQSGGAWEAHAAAIYMVGVLLIGVGFLLLHLDTGWAILSRYGSLTKALGWPQMFGPSIDDAPPPVIVASTMVLIINTLGLISGAAILVMTIVNIYMPSFAIDALLAKNMIFFFGHVFINATIYMAVIAVYEILPTYTGRPWKTSKPFLIAWNASLIMVLAVYPHHLLMDFVMPTWALILGQIMSYTSGLPVLVVTGLGVLINVSRSGIRWDMTSGLLFLATLGWAVGVVPAIVDGTIVVNAVLHNTLWVPGHFHTYLLIGQVTMVFGFMYFVAVRPDSSDDTTLDRLAFWVFAAASFGFTMTFLYAGKASIPRRFAEHLPQWTGQDQVGAFFAALVIVAVLVFVIRFFVRLGRPKTA